MFAVRYTYVTPVKNHFDSIKRNDAIPITALFKVHAPIPIVQPYAGLGAALEFHNHQDPTATPVAAIGADLPIGPLFVTVEYRRQFTDQLHIVSVGAGIKF